MFLYILTNNFSNRLHTTISSSGSIHTSTITRAFFWFWFWFYYPGPETPRAFKICFCFVFVFLPRARDMSWAYFSSCYHFYFVLFYLYFTGPKRHSRPHLFIIFILFYSIFTSQGLRGVPGPLF